MNAGQLPINIYEIDSFKAPKSLKIDPKNPYFQMVSKEGAKL
jgi:predicted proteasome-type protease